MAGQPQIYLDRNENHYGPAPACLEILRQVGNEVLHDYTRDFQSGSYSPLSRHLGEMHGVGEKRIILGYGCEDILKQTIQHCVGPRQSMLMPGTSWWYYRALATEAGGAAFEYSQIAGQRAYRFDVDAILSLRHEQNPGLLLIASPNNPTGNAMPREDLRRVLEHFRGLPVLLDQAYFGFDEHEVDDYGALTDEYPDLLVLRSFSKLHALAGARIGYAIAGKALDKLALHCARSLGYSRLNEKLAMAALGSTDYCARVRRGMAADRELFYSQLRVLEGVRVYESVCNFILARFPETVVNALDAELRRRGFLVRLFKEPELRDTARITLGTPEENRQLLAAMLDILPNLLTRAA